MLGALARAARVFFLRARETQGKIFPSAREFVPNFCPVLAVPRTVLRLHNAIIRTTIGRVFMPFEICILRTFRAPLDRPAPPNDLGANAIVECQRNCRRIRVWEHWRTTHYSLVPAVLARIAGVLSYPCGLCGNLKGV